MTYEDIIKKCREVYKDADASNVQGHIAIQLNVTGEGEGAFYVEVTDGKMDIQPYEYYDRHAIIYISSENLIAILDDQMSFESAYNEEKLGVVGDLGAALMISQIKKKPKKAAAAKKPVAKKTAEKKPATEKKPAVKRPAAKKAPAKKEADKKAE